MFAFAALASHAGSRDQAWSGDGFVAERAGTRKRAREYVHMLLDSSPLLPLTLQERTASLLADRHVVVAHHAELVSAAAAAAAGTAEKIRVMDMAMAALEAEGAEARQQVGHLTQALKEEHEHTQQEVRHVMEELNASHAAEIAVIRDALLAAEAEHAKDKAEAAARQGLELVDVLAKVSRWHPQQPPQ